MSSIYDFSDQIYENINESIAINEKDIYYNKDKFDNGDINLCFITGLSGSGKSTMGKNMQDKDNVEWYQLDDLLAVKKHFTMKNLKEYGDLIYSYFNGIGKKYYVDDKEAWEHIDSDWHHHYEDIMMPQFVHLAMKYAKAHKNRKIVIEGVWLFCSMIDGKAMFKPEEFKDYAFYIKGTSAIVSAIRAAKRDNKNKFKLAKTILNPKRWLWYLDDEKYINVFRKYFNDLIKKQQKESINESLSIDNSKSKDIQTIIDSLSSSDRALMGINSKYKFDDSRAVKEFVAYCGKTPVAYFMIDMQKDKSADVSLAVNPNYQHQGYGDMVARQGTNWINSHIKEFKVVYWATKANNKYSQKLAEKYNWDLVRDDKKYKTYAKKDK